MKRNELMAAFLLATTLAFLPSCGGKWMNKEEVARVQTLQDEHKKLTEEGKVNAQQIEAMNKENSEFQAVMDQVQSSLEELRTKELKIISVSMQGAKEGLPPSQKEKLLAEIDLIKKSIQENKKKLADLRASNEASGKKVKVLEQLVAELQRSLDEKEATIGMLQTTVTELNEKVETLGKEVEKKTEEVAVRDTKIAEQDKEANKAFVLIAKKSDLKTKGLIEKKGQFIFGGAWLPTGKASESDFEPFDLREKTEFAIPAKADSIKILTDHPKESFEITATSKTASVLKIKDTAKFWQNARRLIVMYPD